MSIFGKRIDTDEPNLDSNQEFSGIYPTSESLDQILTETAKDSYMLRAGMYISDIMMEDAVLEGTATPEVLLENFAKDVWKKIKEMFIKMWNKIKDWYNKVKRYLQIFFTSGKNFITKFEKEIRSKNAKGFEYKSFRYTPSKGAAKVSEIMGVASSGISEYSNHLDSTAAKSSSEQFKKLSGKEFKDEYNAEEEKEAILKKLKADDINELGEEVYKAFRNGETEKDDFEDFNSNSKDEMIKAIKDKDKHISDIEKNEKDLQQMVSRIIKAIDTAAGKVKNEEYGKVAPYVSFSTDMMRYCVNIAAVATRNQVAFIKDCARDFESILKSFLRYKPAKESFGDDSDSESSIIESAMSLL